MKIYLLILTTILILNAGMASPQSDTCKFLNCPLNWKPLCGRRGNEFRTFGNRCDFERTNCFAKPKYEFANEGRCAKNAE